MMDLSMNHPTMATNRRALEVLERLEQKKEQLGVVNDVQPVLPSRRRGNSIGNEDDDDDTNDVPRLPRRQLSREPEVEDFDDDMETQQKLPTQAQEQSAPTKSKKNKKFDPLSSSSDHQPRRSSLSGGTSSSSNNRARSTSPGARRRSITILDPLHDAPPLDRDNRWCSDSSHHRRTTVPYAPEEESEDMLSKEPRRGKKKNFQVKSALKKSSKYSSTKAATTIPAEQESDDEESIVGPLVTEPRQNRRSSDLSSTGDITSSTGESFGCDYNLDMDWSDDDFKLERDRTSLTNEHFSAASKRRYSDTSMASTTVPLMDDSIQSMDYDDPEVNEVAEADVLVHIADDDDTADDINDDVAALDNEASYTWTQHDLHAPVASTSDMQESRIPQDASYDWGCLVVPEETSLDEANPQESTIHDHHGQNDSFSDGSTSSEVLKLSPSDAQKKLYYSQNESVASSVDSFLLPFQSTSTCSLDVSIPTIPGDASIDSPLPDSASATAAHRVEISRSPNLAGEVILEGIPFGEENVAGAEEQSEASSRVEKTPIIAADSSIPCEKDFNAGQGESMFPVGQKECVAPTSETITAGLELNIVQESRVDPMAGEASNSKSEKRSRSKSKSSKKKRKSSKSRKEEVRSPSRRSRSKSSSRKSRSKSKTRKSASSAMAEKKLKRKSSCTSTTASPTEVYSDDELRPAVELSPAQSAPPCLTESDLPPTPSTTTSNAESQLSSPTSTSSKPKKKKRSSTKSSKRGKSPGVLARDEMKHSRRGSDVSNRTDLYASIPSPPVSPQKMQNCVDHDAPLSSPVSVSSKSKKKKKKSNSSRRGRSPGALALHGERSSRRGSDTSNLTGLYAAIPSPPVSPRKVQLIETEESTLSSPKSVSSKSTIKSKSSKRRGRSPGALVDALDASRRGSMTSAATAPTYIMSPSTNHSPTIDSDGISPHSTTSKSKKKKKSSSKTRPSQRGRSPGTLRNEVQASRRESMTSNVTDPVEFASVSPLQPRKIQSLDPGEMAVSSSHSSSKKKKKSSSKAPRSHKGSKADMSSLSPSKNVRKIQSLDPAELTANSLHSTSSKAKKKTSKSTKRGRSPGALKATRKVTDKNDAPAVPSPRTSSKSKRKSTSKSKHRGRSPGVLKESSKHRSSPKKSSRKKAEDGIPQQETPPPKSPKPVFTVKAMLRATRRNSCLATTKQQTPGEGRRLARSASMSSVDTLSLDSMSLGDDEDDEKPDTKSRGGGKAIKYVPSTIDAKFRRSPEYRRRPVVKKAQKPLRTDDRIGILSSHN